MSGQTLASQKSLKDLSSSLVFRSYDLKKAPPIGISTYSGIGISTYENRRKINILNDFSLDFCHGNPYKSITSLEPRIAQGLRVVSLDQ